MPVFPQLALRPEVEDYLRESFVNAEVVTASDKQEAERNFEALLTQLSCPPSFTTVRVNTHLASVQHVKDLLLNELEKREPREVSTQRKEKQPQEERNPETREKQDPGREEPRKPEPWQTSAALLLQYMKIDRVPWSIVKVYQTKLHALVGNDTEKIISKAEERKNIKKHPCEVIVGAQCGNAVLRGAHVYVPGIVSASKFMKAGDVVSVYSDIKGKCKKGAKEFDGTKVFLGNGISERSRKEIFGGLPELKGIGVRMTEPVYLSPSFDSVLPTYLYLQNLPSALVTHVLNPQPGEKILDMCAAPGGKTTHIAARMHDQGEVIALDKISNKVEKIKQNASLLGLRSIRAFCFDGTKALVHERTGVGGEPPFLPESFDRVLLDAPCSGMGQRPRLACAWTLKEVTSYPPLQRKLLAVAAQLLKPGGVLVYSTCTVTLAENEAQVAWALATLPCLQLQPQEPRVGGAGLAGAGLSLQQRQQLQRFHPAAPFQDADPASPSGAREEDLIRLANKDCIGFFIAKFVKCKST